MVSRDPAEWTDRQRAAYLADALGELLDTVPTARTTWTSSAEEVREREQRAQRISDRMDAVYAAGRDGG